MSIFTIQRDGLNLVCEREDPLGERYDLAIIMYGFTANRNTALIKKIANKLRDENATSIKFDFNGHGDSDGAFRNMTVWNEIEDVNAILSYVESDPHANHIYLVGLPQGGVVVFMLAGLYPDSIKRVVLLAPAACLKDGALKGNIQGASYDPKKIPDSVPFRNKNLGGFYLCVAQSLPIYEIAQNYCGPVSLIHSTNDQVVPAKYVERYQAIYQNSELHFISGADHRFSDTYQNIASDLMADFPKPDFSVF